ncbi:TIR domain-containing protein [Corallococcus exiguus]|uniref:toll/interleukin-1 receptor domain-containing protein n=1 Tax=Corallococcus exiguus TaxID=83462 RepID=UPI003DA3E4C5
MRVFISWSGERSRAVATALKTWLSDVFHDVEPWMSEHDIDAGMQWGTHLSQQLEAANFGILCLTPDNLASPWLLFEAGALSKFIKSARVVPYRLELKATDVSLPLAQFQGVDADELGTLKLLQSLNGTREALLTDERLKKLFDKWWPDLKLALQAVPPSRGVPAPKRTDRALLEEILQLVRQQAQASTDTPIHNEDTIYGPPPTDTSAESQRVLSVPLPPNEPGNLRGMRVRHAQFGLGTIADVEGAGANAKVTVRFSGPVGLKRVIAQFLQPA